MENFEIHLPEINYSFPMIFVKGTADEQYLFGADDKVGIGIRDFYISQYPITQKLWEYIMGKNPSHFIGPDRPVEQVSFHDITSPGRFLDTLNSTGGISFSSNVAFRLPSETEWEYVARGGTHWKDEFLFSGSEDLDHVGWYDQNSGKYSDREILSKLRNHEKGTETHAVGLKLPNQLGIHDMCGNVWEWCQDYYQPNIHQIPKDGAPYATETDSRVLRGGCHHNWAIHCTVSKRYEITPEASDECIGFRIAVSA